MTSADKRPPAEKIPKKPAPEKKIRVAEEGLKRKHGEIEVKESNKVKRAVEENKISEAEEVFVIRLTDHSGMSNALWFETGEDLSRFSINEFCLITGMKCLSNTKFDNDDDVVKLGLLYMIFCIPLANANSVKIDPKYFAQADNLEEFNAFSWGVLSWEATRIAISNAVENRLSSKRRPLKKYDKVHYSIAGFLYALLVWAYESIPTIVGKCTTKYFEAILRMLSWTSANNVKFDDIMSTLTVVGEKQPKCFVMMPTDEELKDPYVTQLHLKNPTVVPQPPRKTPVTQPSTETSSDSQNDVFIDSDIGVVADKGVKAAMEFFNADKEEGDDEKEILEEKYKEYQEGEEGEAKENEEGKFENGKGKEEERKLDTSKEKEEEKKDEEAKGEEKERNNEEAANEQEESISDVISKQKRSILSRLGQQRSVPMVEIGSPAHAPTKVNNALPRGLSDEPPRKKLEEFKE
ncbi:hypothetical protein TIFTF001_017518 [Ficus carica]|uniref:DUF1985 domain-containing protein n=1 Tax=Ficus carica TaxID=3494 RepID=A0AA88AUG1_FICCA|nr:hypothetical protein TIFTF001_017518 [Ficus carica]